MKKIVKEEKVVISADDYDNIFDIAEEIDTLTAEARTTRGKKEKGKILDRARTLMNLYDGLTGRKNFNKI